VDASGTQQGAQYDCAGRLARVLDGSGNQLARYVYGEGNQRIMSIEGGAPTFFAWAGGQIIAEYEASGANALVWKTNYVYLGGRLLATTSGAGGTDTRFHHRDRLGTRLVTYTDGTVVSEQWTLPFGNMQPFTSVPGGENPYQHPSLGNPSKKRFTSYDRSEATGLDYAVNRFYSPQQGRFTQVDPIEMGAASLSAPQTLNMYAYCGNDPVNFVDPNGLQMSIDWWEIGGFISFGGRGGRGGGGIIAIGIKIADKVAKGVISKIRGIFSRRAARTPPFNPGPSPSISLGDILNKIIPNLGIGVNIDPRTPPLVSGFNELIDPAFVIIMETEPAYSSFWAFLEAILKGSNWIKQKICKAIPSGRTLGVSGGMGGVGAAVGGGEIVVNYDSGQVSAFGLGGIQVDWNGGVSGQVYSGYVWGLNNTNSNYSGGFTGVNGGVGFGGFAASSSGGLTGKNPRSFVPTGDVTAVGGSFGGSLLGGFSGGVNATNYTKPLQLGKFWAFSPMDYTLYATRRGLCR
jgi:RHS repeat-associated protein